MDAWKLKLKYKLRVIYIYVIVDIFDQKIPNSGANGCMEMKIELQVAIY